ncbi:MAG: hypothetical protein ACLFU6_08495 [Candidatus Hydrogenedentota bacterium]
MYRMPWLTLAALVAAAGGAQACPPGRLASHATAQRYGDEEQPKGG